MANLKYMTDYHDLFDTEAFLDTFWKVPIEWNEHKSEIPFLLKEHHKFWSDFEANSYTNECLSVLEFGGGPAMANLISAAKVAKYITFADYTESNRNAVNSWINDEPQAHDWSSMIAYVLNHLEANFNEKAVLVRTQEMRSKTQPAVPCDITKYPIVSGLPYDAVSTSFCIEECSSSIQDYQANIVKLCEVLKPQGYLHMAGNLNESFYVVGKHTFRVLPLEENIVLEAIKNAGMVVTNYEVKELQGSLDASNRRAVFSVSARKK
ncbi:nicotinamide N-methyltransferase-like [Paramuricea clavata]|uniref:Nicotinamide N-methyltransferase-like n=1 Tax=Paramuricea clavata TaxID=317549 RepID=A0A6S7J5W3_PARCT|nr:nicotinamide N-methyltransferase-like [Paramuricea clavata]